MLGPEISRLFFWCSGWKDANFKPLLKADAVIQAKQDVLPIIVIQELIGTLNSHSRLEDGVV